MTSLPTRLSLIAEITARDAEFAAALDPVEHEDGEHGAWIEPVSGERVMLYYDPPTEWQPLPHSPAQAASAATEGEG